MGKLYDGRWEVVKSIGEGAQSYVFLVTDRNSQEGLHYVLKRLKNDKRVDRFHKEIEARKKLDHPQVPPLIDYKIDTEKPYLVETYIDGGDLKHNRSLFEGNWVKTLEYFVQICEVLEYAHNQNIIHRDIKPQNILYDIKADKFQLTDFGICFVIDQENNDRFTLLDEQVGPRDFIAPELVRGRIDELTPVVDVYSLGKLLYWMFSDRTPYRETFRTEESDLVFLKGDSQLERVNQLLDKMIVENPSLRFKSVGTIKHKVVRAIKLMNGGYNVPSLRVQQKCIYCGAGSYDTIAYYEPNIRKNHNHFQSVRQQFERLGLSPSLEQQKIHAMKCKNCGNLQLFVRDAGNETWEK